MRKPRGVSQHHVARQSDRKTPNVSGDAQTDGNIMRSTNKSVPDKLKMHTKAWGPVTNYNGYDNNAGDD